MAQLSRPFQIALLALAVLVLAWLFVLHRPGASSTGSSSPSASSSGAASAKSSPKGGPSHVYHGPVPGLTGLTRDIKRAHEAAAKEERGVGYQEKHAGQTHGGTAPAPASVGSRAQAHASTSSAASAHRAGATANAHPGASATARSHAQTHGSHSGADAGVTAALIWHHLAAATHPDVVIRDVLKANPATWQRFFVGAMTSYLRPASQATIAAELKHGKTVMLLFVNPNSYDDEATAIETVVAAHNLGHSISTHFALANQVDAFGSITRSIQVYQTPTLLIVDPKLQVTTITGFTDNYAIEQAVYEARGKTF